MDMTGERHMCCLLNNKDRVHSFVCVMSRRPDPVVRVFIAADPGVGMCVVGNWTRYMEPGHPTGHTSIETARASHHNVTIGPGAFNVDTSYDENVMRKFIVHNEHTMRANL